jgi:reactive intermediate/imine deaminase
MKREIIYTNNAPTPVGPYSQAVRVGNTVHISGQIPLDPISGEIVAGSIEAETRRVFDNLKAVAEAAGGSLKDAVRVTIFLTDFAHFRKVNEVMAEYFVAPYPARATVGIAQLARGVHVEIDCILELS